MFKNHRSGVSGALLFLLIVSLLPFSYNCIKMPADPVLPKWDTQLTIPLINKTFYFSDIINKDPKFDTSGGTILYKPSSKDIGFKQGIPASVFQMPSPRGNKIDQQMGAVPVSLGVPPSITLSPSQLGLPTGTIPPAPIGKDTSFPVNNVLGDSTSYKWLIYDSGQMTLTVANNFQFSIQFVGNTVQLVNLDDTTQVVGTFAFTGPIAAGTSVPSSTVQLAGKRMYAGLKLKATIQTISMPGKTITSTDNITATLGLANGLISTALVNTLNFSETDVITVPDSAVQLDDSIKVKLAKFQSGKMNVRIVNNAALSLTVEFKIAELIDQSTNQPYRLPGTNPTTGYVTIPPKDSLVAVIDMSKQNFVSRERSGSDTLVTQYLHFSLGMKTLSAGTNQFSVVSKTDNVIADVQPDPLQTFVLQEVQGKVPPQSIDINQTVDAGIGDIGNRLTLTAFNSNIQLSARILSTGLFPTNLVMKVYAIDKRGNIGDSVLIRNSDDIANNRNYHRIVPGVVDVVPIPSSDINTLMNSFLATKQELPSKFLLKGYALVSPLDVYNNPSTQFGVGIGGVKQSDSIFVSLDYAIPVQIGIQNAIMKDTVSISANVGDTAQVNLIQEGKVFFKLSNTLPLGLEVRSKLLKPNPADSSKPSLTDPPVLLLDTIRVEGSQDHSTKSSFTYVSLTGEEATKLSQASHTAIDIRFGTTVNNGTTPVTFNRNDSISVRTAASIKFRVDFDRLK